MKKNMLPIGDLFLVSMLLCLLLYIGKRTHTFVTLQSKSLVHELEHSFADQLYSAQKQTRILQQLYASREDMPYEQWKQKIDKINTGLADIEKKYAQNSPGVMLLGPIGTTSIILKEKELKKKLLEYINTIGSLLHDLLPQHAITHKPFISGTTIDTQIATNQQYISFLLKKSS